VTPGDVRALGIQIDDSSYRRLTHFISLLLAENQQVKLTAAATTEELWRRHVCDSLVLLRAIPADLSGALLDIGSGGGLPGLAVACARPGWRVTLLDATRKKVAALERISAGLKLANVEAVWGRAENLAHDSRYREHFDVATARAVAPLPVLLEYAAGFVVPGGQAWFFKSADALATEIPAAQRVAIKCVLEPAGEVRYLLPGDSAARVLVGYRKVGHLPGHLPRPPGRARKRWL